MGWQCVSEMQNNLLRLCRNSSALTPGGGGASGDVYIIIVMNTLVNINTVVNILSEYDNAVYKEIIKVNCYMSDP